MRTKIPYFMIEKNFLNSVEKNPIETLDELWDRFNWYRKKIEDIKDIIYTQCEKCLYQDSCKDTQFGCVKIKELLENEEINK